MEFVDPLWFTPQSTLLVTTQVDPMACGFPLLSNLFSSLLNHLLQLLTSPIFKNLFSSDLDGWQAEGN